jgi:hypothetical protein
MKVLPTDSRFRELMQSPELTAFTYYWLQKSEEDFYSRLSKILGTSWTHDELVSFKEAKGKSNSSADKDSDVFVPLALAINPDFLNGYLDKMGGGTFVEGYKPQADEEIVSLGDLTPKEFKSMYKGNH